MNTITLVFAGLIAHVLTGGGLQRAVFVNAPLHNARIVVAADDVLEAHGLTEEESAVAGERVFSINDQHLMLDGAGGPTAASDSFERYVPSLAAISDATALRDEVENGELFEGAHAYLDLRGGTLSAGDVMNEAVFRTGRTATTQCVAREVKYVAAAPNGSVTIRGANGAMLRLRAGATARVINEPPPAYTTPHYHMYAMILKDAHVVATPRSTGRSCGTTRDHAPGDRLRAVANGRTASSSLDSDCSNSHWP